MRTAFLHIVAAVSFAVLSVSCGRGSRVIPRDDMAEIYARMFLVDEMISTEPEARRMADTTLVYEPVFEEFGYTADDYRASMAYYIKDPDRYARILKESVLILEKNLKILKAEKARRESISESIAKTEKFRPEKIYYLSGLANKELLTIDSLVLYIDSTGTGSYDFDVQKGYDTLYAGPRIVILSEQTEDSVGVRLKKFDIL